MAGMPELPEVESVRRQLGPRLVGRSITEVTATPQTRFSAVELAAGHRVWDLRRRGKYLLAELDGGLELIMPLGMTGSFRVRGESGWEPDPYVRATFHLDDGAVIDFRDVRRFGTLAVVDAGRYERLATLHALGPEPLTDDFDPAA